MKKTLLAVVCTATLGLTSCGTTQSTTGTTASTTSGTSGIASAATGILSALTGNSSSSTASTATNLLSSVIGTALGGTSVSQESLVGTWTYAGSDCKFESENFLVAAGGDLAATQVKSKIDGYLSKIGVSQGVLTMNLTSDNKCTLTVKGKTISSGTYTYDASTKKITLNSTLGLVNLNALVGMSNGKLSILFDADKMLQVVNALASKLGSKNATASTISSLINNVNGMKVGFCMSK